MGQSCVSQTERADGKGITETKFRTVSSLQVLRYMALRNGSAANNLMLQRVGAAKAGKHDNRGAGVLQLVIHPVLRLRTMVLMYVW